MVDVAVLERDPFARPQAGRGGEQHQRAVPSSDPVGEGADLRPGVERTLSSPSGSSPNAAVAFLGNQRSFEIVSGSASCWARYTSTNSLSVGVSTSLCS
jgi:hypothetical protein